MKLVICEKPSVASSIAGLLKANKRQDGYFAGNGYVVSWCFGHMVEMVDAKDYDIKYEKWKVEDLPILPKTWKYRIIPDKAKQFDVLKRLLLDDRIESIICATDAGREGELIFRLVYDLVYDETNKNKAKPFERLWISSMEDDAILDGFRNLKKGHEFDNLYESANCRSRADWVVGINATRLLTCMYRAPLSVGRVQTPTLSMLVSREKRIAEFVSKKSFSIKIDLGDFSAESEDFSFEEAEDLLKKTYDIPCEIIEVESKERSNSAPKLYDLTTLQRDANRLHGFTAQETLDIAQGLYEKKLITYPRTDSQFITDDMQEGSEKLVRDVAAAYDWSDNIDFEPDLSKSANSAKVSDHHAILPTPQVVLPAKILNRASLPENDKIILEMICWRFLVSSAPKYIYSSTIIKAKCAESDFYAKGKITLQEGWKALQKDYLKDFTENIGAENDEGNSEDKSLPNVEAGTVYDVKTSELVEHETTAPKYYTEDTLLSSMETAGNEDLDKSLDIEKRGIGTPATRAGIIEKIIGTGLAYRNKKQVRPTEKGTKLISVVPDIMESPKLTAEWENQLSEISVGISSSGEFMSKIYELVDTLMLEKNASIDKFFFAEPREDTREVIGLCPRCGSNVYETKSNFRCSGNDCGFALWKDAHFFTNKKQILKKRAAGSLLKNGKAKMRGFVSERTGNKFDATVVMEDTGGKYVKYTLVFDN